jgi:hypothetical protein
MIVLAASDFAAICGGIASLLVATSYLVWAFRRDPSNNSNSDIKRLPPNE